jgi:hypothetical protein
VNEIKGTGSRLENETVILFNDAEEEALVNTASPAVYRRLVKLGYAATRYNDNRARFLVPKRDVKLPRPPRAGKRLSEAHKAALQKGRFTSRTPSVEGTPAQTMPGR